MGCLLFMGVERIDSVILDINWDFELDISSSKIYLKPESIQYS